MKKVTIHIEGMHCVSCESLLEKEFEKVRGLKSCRISHKKGNAEIECDEKVTMSRLEKAVRDSGYSIAKEVVGKRRKSDRPDYLQIIMIAIDGIHHADMRSRGTVAIAVALRVPPVKNPVSEGPPK